MSKFSHFLNYFFLKLFFFVFVLSCNLFYCSNKFSKFQEINKEYSYSQGGNNINEEKRFQEEIKTYSSKESFERCLQTSADPSECYFTTRAYYFGGSKEDSIYGVTSDSLGNVYFVGQTYSTEWLPNTAPDILVFKLDSTLAQQWGTSWGGTKNEIATSVAADSSNVYICGYTNSPAIIKGKEDIFVLSLATAGGTFSYAVRVGFDGVDNAYSIYYYSSILYVVGTTDSTGWTYQNKDMLFVSLYPQNNLAIADMFHLGGSQDDFATGVIASTDQNVYVVGYGSSTELTNGQGYDAYLISYKQSGRQLNYFKHIGGSGIDQGTGIAEFGAFLFIVGHSNTNALSSGLRDIFIACLTKSQGTPQWMKKIGTNQYDEYAGFPQMPTMLAFFSSITASTDGGIYFLGTMQSAEYSYGLTDILAMGISYKGESLFVESFGGPYLDFPGGITYNQVTKRLNMFGNINSNSLGDGINNQVSLSSVNSQDFLFFETDLLGGNQCKQMNFRNGSNTKLVFLPPTASLSSLVSDVDKTVANYGFGTITPGQNTGSIQTTQANSRGIGQTQKTFCSTYYPLTPLNLDITDITVISNTQMSKSLPGFCTYGSTKLTYSLTFPNLLKLEDWMIFDPISLTLFGLVPPEIKVNSQTLLYSVKDQSGYTLTSTFTIYYQSKPYLNIPLPNYSTRSLKSLTITIPRDTFLQPDKLQLTYNISSIPSWMSYESTLMRMTGTPSDLDQGTYTVVVACTDANNQNASTTFQIEVIKNFAPVAQKQIDDQQIDVGVLFQLLVDRDTFIDPNNDLITLTITGAPSWLKFNKTTWLFSGTPVAFNNYTITITATDPWGASASISFTIYTGQIFTTGPTLGTLLSNQSAKEKQLFYYKFPKTIFVPGTVQDLSIYVTGVNGTKLPFWLSYEEVSMTISGTPNKSSTACTIVVACDDRAGGSVSQSFNISIEYIKPTEISYFDLIVVSGALGGFILAAILFLCIKNCKCRCRKPKEDDDSFEENDDVCIDQAQPKNPFKFQKEIEEKKNQTQGMHKENRFHLYNKDVKNARVKQPQQIM